MAINQKLGQPAEGTREGAAAGLAPALPRAARLTQGFRALGVRNYRLFWFGQLISLIGTWMQTTAQAWLVYQLTNSPLALGVVTTVQSLPIMLLSLFGGAIADRVPRYRLILITQIAALVQAALFGALVGFGVIQLWHVYVLALALGVITAIDTPVRQAFVVELVGRDQRPNAIALNSMLFNSARIVGPAVAGMLIARLGIAPAFYLNALSFIGVLGALLMMDRSTFRPPPPPAETSIVRGIAEGLAYIWRTPTVLLIMSAVAVIGTFGYNFNVVLPLLAGFVLHTDSQGFGLLSAMFGAGSLVGALSTAYAPQVSMRRLLLGGAAFSLIFAGLAVSSIISVSGALLLALGCAGIIFTTSANTLIQLHVPDELRGRVVSLYFLLFAGSTPIGGMLIGTLSTSLGVTPTLLLCAAICLAGIAAVGAYRQRLAAVSPEA
ncbi:MAG TPA: MFS transporter [Herpetosiphonaceae bacterium]